MYGPRLEGTLTLFPGWPEAIRPTPIEAASHGVLTSSLEVLGVLGLLALGAYGLTRLARLRR